MSDEQTYLVIHCRTQREDKLGTTTFSHQQLLDRGSELGCGEITRTDQLGLELISRLRLPLQLVR
jgi:hypothetical protein